MKYTHTLSKTDSSLSPMSTDLVEPLQLLSLQDILWPTSPWHFIEP